MAYYVSPRGNDLNTGTSAESALRSITRAMELIAEVSREEHGGDPYSETVHLADGDYDRGSGESFPITILPMVILEGESRDGCVITYTPAPGEDDECGFSGQCLDIYGSVSNLTLAEDPSLEYPVISALLNDQYAVLENSYAPLVYVNSATRVSRVEFVRLFTEEGFERGGALYPLIEDCYGPSDQRNLGLGFHIRGGRVEGCDTSYFWIDSPSRTIVQNNTISICRLFMVHRPLDEPAATAEEFMPLIANNEFQSLETLSDEALMCGANSICVFAESIWRDNDIYIQSLDVGCDSSFFDNTIHSFRIDFGLSGLMVYDALGLDFETRPHTALFEGNAFEQLSHTDMLPYRTHGSPEDDSFITVSHDWIPVFEGNTFAMHPTDNLIPIHVKKLLAFDWSAPDWVDDLDDVWSANWDDFIIRVRYRLTDPPTWISDLPDSWAEVWEDFIQTLHHPLWNSGFDPRVPDFMTDPSVWVGGSQDAVWIENWRDFMLRLRKYRHWYISPTFYESDPARAAELEEYPNTLSTPNPDFGGGGLSLGGNVFDNHRASKPHIKISVGNDVLELWAEGNTWNPGAPIIRIEEPGDHVTYHT